jgi:hypothetical protein
MLTLIQGERKWGKREVGIKPFTGKLLSAVQLFIPIQLVICPRGAAASVLQPWRTAAAEVLQKELGTRATQIVETVLK